MFIGFGVGEGIGEKDGVDVKTPVCRGSDRLGVLADWVIITSLNMHCLPSVRE